MNLGVGEQFFLIGTILYFLFAYLQFYLAITLVFGSIVAYIFYQKYDKTYWARHGVPTIKSHILFGHSKVINKGIHTYDLELSAKYETYGSYMFGRRDLASTNLDILRQVLVKNFDHFVDRGNFLRNSRNDKYSLNANAVTSKTGDDWRRIRHLITPSFTTGKMKNLIPIFDNCAKELCNLLESFAHNGQDIPLKEVMEKLTLNVIGRTAFGVEINAFQINDIPFLTYSKQLFNTKISDPLVYFFMLFPNICDQIRRYTGHQVINNDAHTFFKATLENMFEERRGDKNSSEHYNDFFQLLLNSLDENDMEEKREKFYEDKEIVHEQISKIGKKKSISKIEILAQSFVVLLAGFETTATTLHFILYILAKMPDVQEKVREEIFEVLGNRETISYEDLSKLQYMQQVIFETLRMYPPLTRINRMCTKAVVLNGIEIKEGMTFSIPVYSIHHDERYYPNPYDFNPNRFSHEEKAKRDPLTFLTFGFGPRNCVGMRFAELEILTTLARILKNYRFLQISNSPELPLKILSRGLTKPEENLLVRTEKL